MSDFCPICWGRNGEHGIEANSRQLCPSGVEDAEAIFTQRHPGCCSRCGWHLSSHGHSHGYQSDCPWGVSPAAKDGTLRALQATRHARKIDT